MGNSSRSHHLLKHSLPEVDVLHHFGSIEPKEVSREINKLGQRDLQAKFRAVYGTQTYSNNNCWLRRKLMEAAGLQTPKASSRGRPAVKQGRAPSPGSVSQSEGPSMSRSCSMASQQASDRLSAPECNVIRRTKRPHKPKQYEDMLISAQLPGHQVASDDDEDCRPAKIRATDSEMSYRDDILPGQGQGSELVWSKNTTHSFTASHLIAPSTSWTGALAPPTPEKLPFRTAIPAILATRQGSTASKLLGPQEVLGDYHSNLPAWADLPSNDRSSSQDLDEVSFQVPEMFGGGNDMVPPVMPSAATAMPVSEVLIAPPTPERLMAAARPSAAHLLRDIPSMPIMNSLLTKPSGPQKVSGMMFDYFSSPPPSVTLPDLLPTAPPNFERRTEFPMVSSADMSECSEISELDVLLEGISSNGMTQEFDAWLKDMPCPDLGPCEL